MGNIRAVQQDWLRGVIPLRLEFLQSDGDIVEFVNYLYEQGLSISQRCKQMCDVELDRITAIHKLQHDLYTSWGTYFIGDEANKRLLMLDSCGPQSHPSKLGRQGRLAGVIGHVDKDNAIEKELMRLLRNYFRRNYKFLRYNGVARMSCYFGPHYLRMEADFFDDPRAEDLCGGYLCLICCSDRVEFEKERAANALNRLDVQNVQISVRPYWNNPGQMQLHIPFLYYAPSFSVEEYSSVFSELSFNGRIRFGSSNINFSFRNNLSPNALTDQTAANCIDLLLQRPW